MFGGERSESCSSIFMRLALARRRRVTPRPACVLPKQMANCNFSFRRRKSFESK